jgi:DNA polymerase-1
MLVTKDNLDDCLHVLSGRSEIVLDTETYGVKWEDRLFSLQLHSEIQGFYFNFKSYGDDTPVLDYKIFQNKLQELFHNSNTTWIMHNSLFDLRRITIEGARINGNIWDTMLVARLLYNKEYSYSLDNCLKRIGLAKMDKVAEYVKEHKLYTVVKEEGKKTSTKLLHYDQVPFDIMYEYGLSDVDVTWKLYNYQQKKMTEDQFNVAQNDSQLIKAVYRMMERGIKLDIDYCDQAYCAEMEAHNIAIEHLTDLTDTEYKSGPKWLGKALQDQGVNIEQTDKGNLSLGKKRLRDMDNAIASTVLDLRNHEKLASAFFSPLPRLSDSGGIIHPSFRLAGTDTRRLSCADPNIQQMPKGMSDTGFSVRHAFKPREDHIFVMMDFDQMEYRIMADYANEVGMIEAIKGGLDPHTYVANMMGVDRVLAKTLNFGLLYGMGLQKLADALHLSVEEARTLKAKYYSELRCVQKLHRDIQDTAKSRGYVKNKYGARYYLDKPEFAYKLVNYLIQGTGAEVVRHAMVKLDYVMEGMKSGMLAQIHDEILFEIHKDEVSIVPELKRILEAEYKPLNGMNLTVGCEFSLESWCEETKQDWSEYGH